MPTYVYVCLSCGRRVEMIRSVSSRDLTPRCECGKAMPRRTAPESVAVVGSAKHEYFRPMKERVARALHQRENDGTLNRLRHGKGVLRKQWGRA